MSEGDNKMNENNAEPATKEMPPKTESETEPSSPNESSGAVLADECNDLNTENHNEEGVLDVIESEFNEFEMEQASESISKATTNSAKQQNKNNINLCDNDNEHHEHDSLQVDVPQDETGLYDDVMACPNISASEFNSETGPGSNESMSDNKSESQSSNNVNNLSKNEFNNSITGKSHGYVKRVSCYVGNLTWWTTDQDLTDLITSLGITDLLEIKFYENKINGQSKGFAMVTTGSDQSFRTLMDKLPKKEIHSQTPVVTPFSRHYFNQFEEQARRDMPSTNNGSGGNNNSDSNQYMPRNDSHLGNHHNNNLHSQSAGGQYQNRSNNGNGNRYLNNNVNNNSNMPSGLLGQGPRGSLPPSQSNMMQRPGLVGNYQPRHNMNGPMGNQQSIMGMNNPNSNSGLRPGFNNNNNNGFNNQRNPNHQTSLMGNRPPLVPNANGSGLLPIRPGLNPALVGNNGPIGQGPGLLNNPRMPISNQSMPGMHRQNWEQNSSNLPINNQFNNNMPNHLNNNPLMSINQNSINNRLGPGGNPALSSQNPQQNGILPNPPHPHPFQNQQGMPGQSNNNYQHPHSNQGPNNFNSPINQQQSLMNPQVPHNMMNNLPGQMGNIMPLPQSHLGQLNPSGVNSMPPHQQHDLYFRQGDANATSPGMNQHMGQHMQMNQQQLKMSDLEFQEAFEKNRIVSSSAITRAVQDASIGQFPSAIETLITAISLIKQSKIANDERCKLFIMSLQDTKKGIEDKYYNGGRNMGGGMEMMNSNHSRGESRDRERLKRSRSRDSRDRRDRGEGREDRDRDRDRDRSERGDRDRGSRREKHHRSHRERSSRERSRDRRVVSSNSGNFDSGITSQSDYYDESLSGSGSSRYHRRRH